MDDEIQKTFWGCTVDDVNRATEIKVNKSLHISMAYLDIASDELPSFQLRVDVYMQLKSTNRMVCSLDTDRNWKVPLDVNIAKGIQVSFAIAFNSPFECEAANRRNCSIHREYIDIKLTVHLTGYQRSGEEHSKKIAERITAFSLSFIQETLERASKDRESMENKTSVRSIEDNPDENSTDGSKIMTALGSEGHTDELEMKEELEAATRQKVPEKNERQEEHFEKHEKFATEDNVTEIKTKERQQNISGAEQQHQVHDSSLHVEILNLGEGHLATIGNSVIVNYVGRLVNKKHSYTVVENGFDFCLGKGEVIRGLDEGIAGMKLGGKRRITCPPSMAYGMEGAPPIIPRNSTFVFDIELVGFSC